MYALVYSTRSDTAAKVAAIARTLPAIQRKWVVFHDSAIDRHYMGILGPAGLMNYYGQPIPGDRHVECHLKLKEVI